MIKNNKHLRSPSSVTPSIGLLLSKPKYPTAPPPWNPQLTAHAGNRARPHPKQSLEETIERLSPVYNLNLVPVKGYPIGFLEKRTIPVGAGKAPINAAMRFFAGPPDSVSPDTRR